VQLFDAAIIVTSFTLDLIFVEGITGVQGEETLAFIIIFLLWRVLRVINGTNAEQRNHHSRIKNPIYLLKTHHL